MVAIVPGKVAPDFLLASTSGESLGLNAMLVKNQALVLAFFKVSCPVCQFTFPYLERLYRRYPGMPILGISQDDAEASAGFARMYNLSFPLLLDEKLRCTVNFELTNVPTVFLVNKDRHIELTSVGFVKTELEELNNRLAVLANAQVNLLFTKADDVPEFKPG